MRSARRVAKPKLEYSAAGRALMDSIQRPWSLCENLGALESICTCPAVMTHANMLAEDRLKVGITDGFVRLSVGIEHKEDLIASLKASHCPRHQRPHEIQIPHRLHRHSIHSRTRRLPSRTQASLDALIRKGDSTVVLVAHRLSTVMNADKIAVIADGGVKEEGSHDELCAKGGVYAGLVR